MSLKLYAHMISQPSRAVAWILKVKGVDYEFVKIDPMSGEARTPKFLKKNPRGSIPVLQDEDFFLAESHAIMTYLAQKHKWNDLYPQDLKARARVDEYLHWHHSTMRRFTYDAFRPHLLAALGKPQEIDAKTLEKQKKQLNFHLQMLEKFLIQPYIAQSTQPTLADYSCYCELDQIEAIGTFDFSKYPNTQAWMQRMKQIPYHDDVGRPLKKLVSMFVNKNTGTATGNAKL